MLSKRLETIKSFVDYGASVADIGADHGQLIIDLVKSGIVKFAYASDNKKGPYEILCKAIYQANLSDKVVVKMEDGLTNLPTQIDTIVLSGMGGDLVQSILNRGRLELSHIDKIIISSHTQIESTRKFICEMGYYIEKEEIIFEKHFYEIIKFSKGHSNYDEFDYIYGPILRRDKNFVFCLKYQKRKKEIIALLDTKELSNKRRLELQNELERIESL